MDISGSTVLLTGASGGIGQAIARKLAGRDAQLVLTGRRLEILQGLAEELKARAIAVDLSKRDELDRLVNEAGEIDILVANAGVPAVGQLESFTLEQFDSVLDVNLRAPMALTHALTPAMARRGRGHVVFTSSLSGKMGSAYTSLYSATKFGLRGFAQSMRAELHSAGVGISAVFPGPIRDAGMLVESGMKIPPGVGTSSPEDVARAIVSAIERNRGEVDVLAPTVRVGTFVGRLKPDLTASFLRKMGGERLVDEYAQAQVEKP
jgi:short-subunit dehydrogenase